MIQDKPTAIAPYPQPSSHTVERRRLSQWHYELTAELVRCEVAARTDRSLALVTRLQRLESELEIVRTRLATLSPRAFA